MMGNFINDTVIIYHSSGFFSNCNVRLTFITQFIDSNKRLPHVVDSSNQFKWYKVGKIGDITHDYFEHYNNINDVSIDCKNNFNYHWSIQFQDYTKINYKQLTPLIKKYFSPSLEINTIIKQIEDKYNINYNNICVLFYRGNDKNTETKICDYNEYILQANKILKQNPTIQFLIQSDETEFIETMKSQFPNNSFIFKDEIRHMNKCNSTVDIIMKEQNYVFSKYYLAITIIMSKCKYIVCGSGNCSLFIVFYRGNANNIYQNLNNRWIIQTSEP